MQIELAEDECLLRKEANTRSLGLWELFVVFFTVGVTGFGPAYAVEIRKHLLVKRKCITEDDFIHGLALAQILPGAVYLSFAAHFAYKLRGVPGALVCFIAYLLPTFSVMLALSFCYFQYGSLPQISMIFSGLAVIVTALIIHAAIVIGKASIRDWKGIGIAAGATIMMFWYPNIFLLYFLAALVGIVLYYRQFKQQLHDTVSTDEPESGTIFRIAKALAAFFALCGIVFASLYREPLLFELVWMFFKMGMVLVGGGPAMIPFIQQEVINNHGWLTMDEFAVGIALGQVTPGPFLIITVFIGYKIAQLAGAAAATVGMFLPSLWWIFVTTDMQQKIRNSIWVKAIIRGISPANVGTILIPAMLMIQHALVNAPSTILAISAFLVLLSGRISAVWVVIGGTMIYCLFNLAGA